jgi:hypothetical protein
MIDGHLVLLVIDLFAFILFRLVSMIPWHSLCMVVCPNMLLFAAMDIVARWASHNGFEFKTPRVTKLDNIIRVYHMATDPLYVVSPLEQARKDQAREMKAARTRTKRNNEDAEAKERNKKEAKERMAKVRSDESKLETEARLEKNRKRWAASDYKDKRKEKRLKDRKSDTHEEMLDRLDSYQAHNTPEKKQSYNSDRCNKRKAESLQCSDNRRCSNRTNMLESRQRTAKNKRISELIWSLMQLAAKAFQGTCVTDTPGTNRPQRSELRARMHRARVCLICNSFIRGYHRNGIPTIKGQNVKEHFDRLSVEKYEKFHKVHLKPELIKQYEVKGLKGMLLSRNAKRISRDTYPICVECNSEMKHRYKSSLKPPTFAIANGFVIGWFPKKIQSIKRGVVNTVMGININPVMKAVLAPVRPYGWVFQHFGGCQKSILGHYQFFETDQKTVTGALNYLKEHNASNIFVMLCGAMTAQQKHAILNQSLIDIDLYRDLRSWFSENNEHPSFKGQDLPNDITSIQPTLIQDKGCATDKSEDEIKETSFEGATWSFSSAQDPSTDASVFETARKFACALVNRTIPKLLISGGTYVSDKEIDIEAVLPFVFPYGLGGPKTERRKHVPLEACIRHYMRLAMPQFMAPDTILIFHHIYSRQISYQSGVMTCRYKQNNVNGFVNIINRLTPEHFNDKQTNGESINDPQVEQIVRSITTACKAMGHTSEHAAQARKKQFAMMDHFGMNSLFLTITPDDECSFRVRLYAEPDKEVNTQKFCPKDKFPYHTHI